MWARSPAAIPGEAYDNAQRCLLDAIGCGLFGASQPWSRIMSAQLLAEKSQGSSTVFDDECEAVYSQRFGSRVQLHLANGEIKEAVTLDPHGTPADPCSNAELAAKFARLAALSPLKVNSTAVACAAGQLRHATSLRELGRALRMS